MDGDHSPAMTPKIGGPLDIFHSRANRVPLPLITRAKGIHMWDEDGREYIDVSSGPVVSNIGHGNSNVAAALARQAETMDFAYSRVARHQPNIDLAERVCTLAGPGFERVCFSSGGSEAMEIALKLMRQHALVTSRKSKARIISCLPSYHGSTIGTLAIGGDDNLRPFLEDFAVIQERVPAPLTYRVPDGQSPEAYALKCAQALNEQIEQLGAENVLAFVIEPVGGLATGCLVPPPAYFEAVRRICSRHGVFLVFDEILCGIGRTGRFLAAHHHPEALPDIVVLAKGLGAGYAPLGATLVSARLVEELTEKNGFNFMHTYAGNPIACAAALAVLDEYRTGDLIGNTERMGLRLRRGMGELQAEIPCIGDIRGRGLLMAMEIVRDARSKQSFGAEIAAPTAIRRIGLGHGLIIYARQTAGGKFGDWFMVSPPLTITAEEVDELVKRLRATLLEFQASVS
jgi:adenosylmethionine-8-amino-7-oxononanoate aminotransferase